MMVENDFSLDLVSMVSKLRGMIMVHSMIGYNKGNN